MKNCEFKRIIFYVLAIILCCTNLFLLNEIRCIWRQVKMIKSPCCIFNMTTSENNSYTFQGRLINFLPCHYLLFLEFEPPVKSLEDIDFEFEFRVISLNSKNKIIQNKIYKVTNSNIDFYVAQKDTSNKLLIIRNFWITPETNVLRIIFCHKNSQPNLFSRIKSLRLFYPPEFKPTILLLICFFFALFSVFLFIIIKIIYRMERHHPKNKIKLFRYK